MSGINGKSLNEWMLKRIEMCRVRHYYRQFAIEPDFSSLWSTM